MRISNYLRRLAALSCGVLLCAQLLTAQNMTVKGRVVDSANQAVIGAAVMQAGTSNGAACDVDGNGTADAADALIIMRYALGLIDTL